MSADLTTGPDTPQAIAQRRRDLLAATGRAYAVGASDRSAWAPCEGVGRPLDEAWITTNRRGYRVAQGWCRVCGELVGGRWTNATKSAPLPDGLVLARRHKDKRP